MKPAAKRGPVTVFAPATVANVAVGFDILGFAVGATGDRVTVERIDQPRVEIASITARAGVAPVALPTDPASNTATLGLLRMIEDLELGFGFRVSIEKGIALGSGMGGSAASAVGAVVAANAFLETPLSREEQLKYSLVGESVASGAFHADNIAPCLIGGLTLVRSVGPIDVVEIPWPEKLRCVLVHPHLMINTREARGILKDSVKLKDHVRQSANLGAFLAGCFRGDPALISRSLTDVLIEPQRSGLIPGFAAIKKAAFAGGALGCSISGSGPSVFAIVDSEAAGEQVRASMVGALLDAGVKSDSWTGPIERQGARIV